MNSDLMNEKDRNISFYFFFSLMHGAPGRTQALISGPGPLEINSKTVKEILKRQKYTYKICNEKNKKKIKNSIK